MSRPVQVHLLPERLSEVNLSGSIAVIIDVFRASTTIVHALAAGARAVVPCEDVDEARRIAAGLPTAGRLLGGERGGTLIEGFDLDNSPLRYLADIVGQKTIVFTTTNGTRALRRSEAAGEIVIGAFVNLNAVVSRLAADTRPVHFVCAGTRGQSAPEDTLCAAAVARGLSHADPTAELIGDDTASAVDTFDQRADSLRALSEYASQGPGWQNLMRLGFEADIRRAMEWDRFHFVPTYDKQTRSITADIASTAATKVWQNPPTSDLQE